jgi:Zn finger protein HypA/HybF involved in hydrogenase expression
MEMIEERKLNMVADKMLESIVECLTDKNLKRITFIDGSIGQMTRTYAKSLSKMHDRLDESNRTAFLILASQDKQSFEKAVEFSKNNEEESV